MIIIYSLLLDSANIMDLNQNFQPTEQSYIQNQIHNPQSKSFPTAYCDNQFYQLQKTQFRIEIQRVNFQGIKCFLQLTPDRFVIGALKKQIKEAPIHLSSYEHVQRPHTTNRVKRPHQRAQNNEVNIQINDVGDINQHFNIDINNPILINGNIGLNFGIGRPGIGQNGNPPRQINLGNARNIHRRTFLRRIGYISSDQQNEMNIFNGTILYLFYVDIQGNIINKIRYGVGNNYKISHYSHNQILLQICQKQPPLLRQKIQSKLTVAKLDLETKQIIQIYKTRQYKPKTSLYFPQTKFICVIERYSQTIIENISVRYFSCNVKETSVLPDYQYTFELNENEDDFHFIKGNNRGLAIWYMKVLGLFNQYIQFYYKSNENNQQQSAQRIVIQKPELIKCQDYSIQSILQAGENASKFILFISSRERLYTFVYEVHKKIFREICLPLCQLGKRLRIDLIVSFVTRIIINSSVYYVDNVTERIFCYDYLYDSLPDFNDDNDQEQFTEYSNDFLNQVRYFNSTFQIRSSRIVKVQLFASVFLLEQIIIDAYKEKIKSKELKLNENGKNEERENQNGVVWTEPCHLADMDLVFQVVVLLGLIQK